MFTTALTLLCVSLTHAYDAVQRKTSPFLLLTVTTLNRCGTEVPRAAKQVMGLTEILRVIVKRIMSRTAEVFTAFAMHEHTGTQCEHVMIGVSTRQYLRRRRISTAVTRSDPSCSTSSKTREE